MKKRIIERYVLSMDGNQFAADVTDASKEFSTLISSFDPTDIPVVIHLLQSYAQGLLAISDDMQADVDAIADVLKGKFVGIPDEKYGGTDNEL